MAILRCHWDADGITTALFTSYGVPDSEVQIGDCEKPFGYTEGLGKNDWILDMKPDNPEWDGNCIDHHLPHPDKHNYKLISKEYPATLIAWELFKDKIPQREWWKLSIGLVGDGQPELIPNDVFKQFPSLLRRVKTSVYQSYGKWSVNIFPMYKLLSSGLNALLRKGDTESAWNLLKYSTTPEDIYSSETVSIAKNDIKKDVTNAILNSEIVNYGNLSIIVFHSKYRMSGYIASTLENSSFTQGRTIMAINKRNGSLSLRGDLAEYYKDIITNKLDYITIDGHLKYMGGKLFKNYDVFLADLDNIL